MPSARSFLSGCRHGDRSDWVLIPARIRVACKIVPDLEDGEHAAHINCAERTLPAEHRNTVSRQRACPSPSCRPIPVVPHRHVVGEKTLHASIEALWIHAQHVRQPVSHLIHNVVGHVAVKGPNLRARRRQTRCRGVAPNGHEHGCRRLASFFRDRASVGAP